MKLFTILAFTCVLLGLALSQNPAEPTEPGNEITSDGYDFSALTPLVKGMIDGFRMMMLQVRFMRLLFENLGTEMSRIARNATISPASGSNIPFPFPTKYASFNREETSEGEATTVQPTESQATFTTQIQEIFDRWGQNTAVAFRGLLTEVAHVYQDAITTMVKQGEVSRNQVVQGFNTVRSAMTSISKMIQDNFPGAATVANSISNIGSALNQNVTNILSGMVPGGLPSSISGIPGISSISGLAGNLQDLIPTIPPQSGSPAPAPAPAPVPVKRANH